MEELKNKIEELFLMTGCPIKPGWLGPGKGGRAVHYNEDICGPAAIPDVAVLLNKTPDQIRKKMTELGYDPSLVYPHQFEKLKAIYNCTFYTRSAKKMFCVVAYRMGYNNKQIANHIGIDYRRVHKIVNAGNRDQFITNLIEKYEISRNRTQSL